MAWACLCLCACDGTQVSGRVSAPIRPGKFVPMGGVEVLLINRDLPAFLRQLRAQYESELLETAREGGLQPLRDQRVAKQEELEAAISSLRGLGWEPVVPRRSIATGAIDCVAQAESQAATARERHAESFARLRPRLVAAGIESGTAAGAIEALRAAAESKLKQEALRLRDLYGQKSLTSKSSVLLSMGGTPDQLCWSIANGGDLILLRLDLRLTYERRVVPDPLAKRLWALPFDLDGVVLRGRNADGEELAGLPPGGTFDVCFYARTGAIDPDAQRELESLGLPADLGPRSGGWAIEWRNPVLSHPSAASAPVSDRDGQAHASPVEAFATELKVYRSALIENALLAELTSSETAKDVKRSEEVLAACRRADRLERELAELVQAVAALEQGRADAPAAKAYLAARAAKTGAQVKRRTALVAKVRREIEQSIVAFEKTAADGTFSFEDVSEGRYTLVATSTARSGGTGTWILAIDLQDDVHRELGKTNGIEGTLTEALRLQLFDEHPEPARKADSAPGAPARKTPESKRR